MRARDEEDVCYNEHDKNIIQKPCLILLKDERLLVTRLWRTRTTAQKSHTLCAIQCVCLGYYHRLRDHVPVKKLHEHTTKLCFIAVKKHICLK